MGEIVSGVRHDGKQYPLQLGRSCVPGPQAQMRDRLTSEILLPDHDSLSCPFDEFALEPGINPAPRQDNQ
jgi:hypothetical protein